MTVVHTVGIGEGAVTQDREDSLITFSIGSCVALTLYDPEARVGGLVHCMLPTSKIDPVRAERRPHVFTDTGVTRLLEMMFESGAERSRVIAKVAGAAAMIDEKGFFSIGERNYSVLRKVLANSEIQIAAEDVGGTAVRTLSLDMATGQTCVRTVGREAVL